MERGAIESTEMNQLRHRLVCLAAALFLVAISVIAVRDWWGERRLAEGRRAQKEGNVNKAVVLYEKALDLGKADAAVAMARIAYLRRDWDKALHYIEKATEITPVRGYLRILHAYTLAAATTRWSPEDIEEILVQCRNGVALDPTNPDLWKSYGEIVLDILGREEVFREREALESRYREEMIQAFQTAVKYSPRTGRSVIRQVGDLYPEPSILLQIAGKDNQRVLTEAVLLLLEKGRWEDGAELYWEVSRGAESARPFYLAAADALQRSREPVQSLEVLKEYLSRFPDDGEAHSRAALIAFAAPERDWETVRGHHLRALELEPGRALFRRRYGLHLYRMGELEAGLEQLLMAVKENPRDAETHFILGRLYEKVDDRKKAKASFLRAFSIRPEVERYRNAAENM